MKRLKGIAMIAALGIVALCAPVMAEEEAAAEEPAKKESWLPGGLAGNIGIVTDYSFRGISQTNRDMAVQGGVDWSHDSGVHLGYWASSVNFGDAAPVEYNAYMENDFYGGYTRSFGDYSFDVFTVYYFYPGDERFNYWEFILNNSYDFSGYAKLTVGIVGSPDYLGILGPGWYPNAGINIPIPLDIPYFDLAIDAKGGWSTAADPFYGTDHDYGDGSLALQVALPFGVSLDFRGVFTDIDEDDWGNSDVGNRFVFGAKYAF